VLAQRDEASFANGWTLADWHGKALLPAPISYGWGTSASTSLDPSPPFWPHAAGAALLLSWLVSSGAAAAAGLDLPDRGLVPKF
jgi:hypothetical protein